MEYTGMYNDDFVSINYSDIPPNFSTNSSYVSSSNNPSVSITNTTITPLSSPPSSLLSPTVPFPSSTTTSTTFLDKIKSFKPSYNNQRRNTLQFSICKKSGCNNRLIIDDSKTMGYCSMMCQLNDWSQPSTLTDSTNDNCGLSEEGQLDLGGNNELSGMREMNFNAPNAGNRFSGINFKNFSATKREIDNVTVRLGDQKKQKRVSPCIIKRQPTQQQQKLERIKSWNYFTRQNKSDGNSITTTVSAAATAAATAAAMTMATTNLATMPLSLNDFSEILPSNHTNIVDYPSPSHNLTSFNLGSYSDLGDYTSNLSNNTNVNDNNHCSTCLDYDENDSHYSNDFHNHGIIQNINNNQQNYFVLNNDDLVDAAAQPQQPLSFDNTSEFVIMTTCSACTFLNDSRSIMCVLCHNPLSPQELNISYPDDNYNVPFSQPYSLPSQPQIQQQLQHQIQQQQQSLQPHPQLQPNVQQQLPFPRLHSHPSQPRLQRQLEQQIQHLQIQRQLRPPTTQQFQPQLQPQFPIQSQTQEQLGQHLQMQQNVQLQMQQNFQLQFQQQQLQSQMQQSQVQQPLLPKRQQSQLRTNALLRINALQRIQLRQKLSQQRLQQQRSKQQRLQQLKRLQQTSHLQTQPQSQPQPQLLSNFSFPTSIPSTPTSFNASDPTNKCVLSKTKLNVLSEGDAEYNQIRDYFFIGLPHANIHSIIQLQMPTKLINAHAQYKHTSLLNHLSTTQEDNLDKFTYRMFHGTKISCNPKRLINGHNSYCMFNCGMCGIIQNGNQRKYSRFNGRMWFANNSAISLGYCNLSTSRTLFNCTPFASKSSLLAMFVVDVVSYNSSDIIIVDKDEATLPRYLILFEIGF